MANKAIPTLNGKAARRFIKNLNENNKNKGVIKLDMLIFQRIIAKHKTASSNFSLFGAV